MPTEVCGHYNTKHLRRRLNRVQAGLVPDASTLVCAAWLPAMVQFMNLSKQLICTCCMQAEPSTTQTSEPAPDTALLKERLRPHPDLVLGKLDNGLNYAILPAVTPPGRFEAHLEIHAGKLADSWPAFFFPAGTAAAGPSEYLRWANANLQDCCR